MTLEEAIQILKDYNKWRRGECEDLRHTPSTIGEAIDTVVHEYDSWDGKD